MFAQPLSVTKALRLAGAALLASSLLLAGVGCAAFGNASSTPIPPDSFSSDVPAIGADVGAALDEGAQRCDMYVVKSTPGHRLYQLDYPRCQISFTVDATFDDAHYDIKLGEILQEGKGHNYTMKYINRRLRQLDDHTKKSLRPAN
ncbi:MAG: hypothetical protein ILO10_07525 [Kiritimatiellae bacterium]|nr:hypothetical protein [Kiritimatiellia bacterium]